MRLLLGEDLIQDGPVLANFLNNFVDHLVLFFLNQNLLLVEDCWSSSTLKDGEARVTYIAKELQAIYSSLEEVLAKK